MRISAVVVACAVAAVGAACSPGDQDHPEAVDARDVPFQLLDTTTTTVGEPASPSSLPATLYFVLNDGLAPVMRLDASPASPRALLETLLDGPTSDEARVGLTTAIPSGTRVAGVERAGSTLVVQLTSDLGPTDNTSPLAVGQLVLTAAAVPGIDEVRFEVDGDAVQVPKGDGTLADGPVTAADYRELQ